MSPRADLEDAPRVSDLNSAPMTERDARVVRWARLFRLLADRHEYMDARDLDERIDRTSPFRALDLAAVDAEAIEDATDTDRVCGAAVRVLRNGWDAGVVEILGYLDHDRLAAVALALPENRRRAVLGKDVNWAMVFSEVNVNAVREVEALIRDFDAVGRELDEAMRALGLDPERFTEQARRYLAGLPHDLSPEEVAVFDSE